MAQYINNFLAFTDINRVVRLSKERSYFCNFMMTAEEHLEDTHQDIPGGYQQIPSRWLHLAQVPTKGILSATTFRRSNGGPTEIFRPLCSRLTVGIDRGNRKRQRLVAISFVATAFMELKTAETAEDKRNTGGKDFFKNKQGPGFGKIPDFNYFDI